MDRELVEVRKEELNMVVDPKTSSNGIVEMPSLTLGCEDMFYCLSVSPHSLE